MSTSNYHHGDLRAALVAAGLAILEETGDTAALSLREAARRAGVSAMAPYRHFADKEALLAAVAAVGFSRLERALREADRAPAPTDALIGQGVAYVDFACAHPALFRLMFGRSAAGRDAELASMGDAAFAVMSVRVATIFDTDTPDWTLRCWAIAHGLASLAVDGQIQGDREPMTAVAERILGLDRGLFDRPR